jgi:hypothetical protein
VAAQGTFDQGGLAGQGGSHFTPWSLILPWGTNSKEGFQTPLKTQGMLLSEQPRHSPQALYDSQLDHLHRLCHPTLLLNDNIWCCQSQKGCQAASHFWWHCCSGLNAAGGWHLCISSSIAGGTPTCPALPAETMTAADATTVALPHCCCCCCCCRPCFVVGVPAVLQTLTCQPVTSH